MRMFAVLIVFMAFGVPKAAFTESLRVVTDIAPVHSLVAQIMDGVGEPEVLLPANVSPHDYSMRPSDARLLQDADAVFWVGDALTPWLADTLETLSGDAVNVPLIEAEGALLLGFREDAVFAASEDDHDHESSHAHDDDHGHDSDAHEGHEHSGADPHAWLDPANAKLWLGTIAAELSTLDPENSERYQSNLVAAEAGIDVLLEELSQELKPFSDLRFVVLHDGYRYFEDRFGLRAIGAISENDANAPSAGRVRDIRRAIESENISCLFTEVQLQSPLLEAIAGETGSKVVTLDPLGALLAPGKDLYANVMRAIAASFRACR